MAATDAVLILRSGCRPRLEGWPIVLMVRDGATIKFALGIYR
jgi:hypothetical protein